MLKASHKASMMNSDSRVSHKQAEQYVAGPCAEKVSVRHNQTLLTGSSQYSTYVIILQWLWKPQTYSRGFSYSVAYSCSYQSLLQMKPMFHNNTSAGLIAGGFLHKASSVWCDGRPDWQPISDIPELAHLLAAAAFEKPTAASHSSRVSASSRASGASGGAAGAAAAR